MNKHCAIVPSVAKDEWQQIVIVDAIREVWEQVQSDVNDNESAIPGANARNASHYLKRDFGIIGFDDCRGCPARVCPLCPPSLSKSQCCDEAMAIFEREHPVVKYDYGRATMKYTYN
jgi:hypothetical protein